MPFNESGVWLDDRRALEIQDQVRRAAEWLATQVESYLYDQASGKYQNYEFLTWAVAQYDVLKTGSGNYAQMHLDYEPERAAMQPVLKPEDPRRVSPNSNIDAEVRYPDAAYHAGYVGRDDS